MDQYRLVLGRRIENTDSPIARLGAFHPLLR